jgi:choline transport protein
MAGWFFWNVGTAILVSRMAFSTVLMCHPDFDLHPYHIYLGYVLCLLLAQLMNTYGFSLYRHMMNTMVIFINAITLIIMVSLLVQASPKQSAETVFVTVINETGWSSTGLVFLLSLLPGITALNGLDSAAHLTEEIQNPGVHIPQVMMGSFLLGGIIAIPMAIIYMLCATNWGKLLNPIAGSSFTQLIFDGVNNTPLAVFITVMLCVISTVATGTLTVTFSRILNSFARQRFFAFSPWMARISTRTNTPNNAVTVCTLSSIIAGLLMLGNSTALNAFLGSAAVCFFCSYMIPISCLLYRGRSALPETYYFRLGRLGRVFGWVSLVWMTLMSVMLCFPQYVPVTAATMNYTAPVVIGLFLIAALNWHLYARNYMVFSSTSS